MHRTGELDSRDTAHRYGIPVTSPARAMLDIAPTLTDRQLEKTFDAGLKERRFSRHAVATTETEGSADRAKVKALQKVMRLDHHDAATLATDGAAYGAAVAAAQSDAAAARAKRSADRSAGAALVREDELQLKADLSALRTVRRGS